VPLRAVATVVVVYCMEVSARTQVYHMAEKRYIHLGSARNPGIRGSHIFAFGDVFNQLPSHVVGASAPAVGEHVQAAVALVGAVAGVDDRQSRACEVGDSLALAHEGGTGGVGNRGEFGVGEERRVVCGTGAVVAALFASEEVDDWSLAAVGTRLVGLTGLLGLLHKGPTLHQFAALGRHEPEGWP
jgi:hypothetical protein